jgi:hypothetical protein
MPMATPHKTERGILVFAIWAVLGFAGLGFVLEGFARDSYLISLLGTGLLAAAFIAHIIVNAVFAQGFEPGEAALGIGVFGLLAGVFIVSWFGGALSMADFHAGLTLFGGLVAGFLAYLSTRYGLRGAFSRFHAATAPARDKAR